MAHTPDPKKLRLDPRLAERLARKKAQLDRYRPLPPDTVHRLNDDLLGLSTAIREPAAVQDHGIVRQCVGLGTDARHPSG